MAVMKLLIPKMACGNCFNVIKNALSKTPGIKGVSCDLAEKAVTVEYDGPDASPEGIREKLSKIGFAPSND